jgi:CHAD domain-containing protein
MSATVELVLAIDAAATRDWIAARGVPGEHDDRPRLVKAHRRADASVHGKRAGRQRASWHFSTQADIGAVMADALGRVPGVKQTRAVEFSTMQVFIEPRAGWRVEVWADAAGRRTTTEVSTDTLTPGVRRCEAVCHPPGDADALDPIPSSTKNRLRNPDKLIPSPLLSVRRGAWRWIGPHGVAIDIELHDARGRAPDGATDERTTLTEKTEQSLPAREPSFDADADRMPPPITFCELRLVAPLPILEAATSKAATLVNASAPAEKQKRARTAGSAAASAAAEPTQRNDSPVAVLEALFAAAGALADVLPVFPVLTDGYARACVARESDAPVRAGRIDLSRADTAHDALIAVGSSIARQWLGNEAGVRAGRAPEFVHQMRVALRRLKTLSKTFPRWCGDIGEETIAVDIDWLGTQLGMTRDLDVFVEAILPALVRADVGSADWAPVQARAVARRGEAHAQLQEALRSRRYRAFTLVWLQWLATQRLSPGLPAMAREPLTEYAAKRVRKHYKRLVGKPDLTSLTPAERHRRRLEVKHLRYTLEFFESLASRNTRRKVAKQLSRIQSVLGDGSDAATALHFLETLDVSPYQHGFARGWCEAVNRWSAIEGERLLRELTKPKIVRVN